MTVFDPALYDPNASLADYTGLTWYARDNDVPRSGREVKTLVFSPRVGFAWDVQGTGQTIVRGGYGLFNYHDAQAGAGTMDLPAGQRQTSVGGGLLLSEIPNVVPGATRESIEASNPDDDLNPRTQSWSLTLQRRLPWSMTFETSYVGSKSDQLRNAGLDNLNLLPFGAMLGNPDGDPNLYRPFQLYGNINLIDHTLYSNYHSWQNLVSRQTGKLSFTAAYTFSKALGIRGGQQGQAIYPPNLADIRDYSYGVLGNDRRHLLSFAYSWLSAGGEHGRHQRDSRQLADLRHQPVRRRRAAAGDWRRGQLPHRRDQRAGSHGQQHADHGVQRHPRHAGADVRSSRDRRCRRAPECFAAPSPGQNGNFVWPEHRRALVREPRLVALQELPVRRQQEGPVPGVGVQRLQHAAEGPRRRSRPEPRLRERRPDQSELRTPPENNKYGRRIIQLAFKFYF